jgi:hypothetical protein
VFPETNTADSLAIRFIKVNSPPSNEVGFCFDVTFSRMSYTTIEPTVIDEELIRKAINEQLNPEVAEIAKKEGVDPEEVEYLRLDYKSIHN